MGNLVLSGATSGSITLEPTAVAGTNTITLPAETGTFLTTGSSGQSIPKAALPTGSVLQVVSTDYQTELSLTSGTYTEITGLNTSLTPTASSSKVLITGTLQVANNASTGGAIRLYRNSTIIGRDPFKWFYFGSNNDTGGTLAWSFLDSPATTSSVTYKVYWRCDNASYTIYLNRTDANTSLEKGGSQITLMEISA